VLEVGCGTGTNLRKLAGSYPNAIAAAASRLAAGGCLAVVDFHDSPFASFNRFMELNHVRLGGHLLEELQRVVNKSDHRVSRAFLGIWRFFTFLS
jgi:S-adenosylmethionine-diacylgycerolhomoserine-N-methlytransferase